MIGIDLYTVHRDAHELCNGNFGVYAYGDSGMAGGLLKNSDCVIGGWAGYNSETNVLSIGGLNVSAGLVFGAITGYRMAPVLPLVIPSLKIGRLRFSYLPRSPGAQTDGIHISIEFEQDKPATAGFFTPINK